MSMDIEEVEARKMEELLNSDKPIVTTWLVYSHLDQIQEDVTFIDVFTDGQFAGTFGTYDTDLPYALHVGEEYVSIERKSKTLKIVFANGTELEVRPLDLIFIHKNRAYDMVMNQISEWKGMSDGVVVEVLKCVVVDTEDTEARENCVLDFTETINVNDEARISAMVTQFVAEASKGNCSVVYILVEISPGGIAFESVANGHEWKRYRIYPSKS